MTPTGGAGEIRIPKPAAPVSPPPQEKSKTSRIPLEAATAAPEVGPSAPKTVRIRPVVPPTRAAPLSVLDKLTEAHPEEASAEKRKTSRIPLEAALAAEPTGEGIAPATAPKTIRLKRPAAPGVAAAPPPQAPTAGETGLEGATVAATVPKGELSKTARLEEEAAPQEEEEGPSPTRKKTIRIKRPPPAPTFAGTAIPGAQAARLALEAPPPTEEPHWAFAAVTGLSILVLVVTLWMLAAQTFGPNVSLTKTSYGAPGLDLPWPGKLRFLP